MFAKVVAVASFVMLPLSVALWHRSHLRPAQYRYDLTLYKSVWVSVREGVCGLRVLSMPTKTPSRTEFRNPLRFDPVPSQASFRLSTARHGNSGEYRTTWIVFPFWLLTALLTFCTGFPVIRGPLRQLWRRWRGRCVACGYDLTGNRSGRCPECGYRVH
jgi:hypothetical protein